MFQLNFFDVLIVVAPVIIVLWKFFHVVFEEISARDMYEVDKEVHRKTVEAMQKDFKKIEKELREYGTSDWTEEELSEFAESLWDKHQPNLTGAVMGDKVLLKELVCEYCGTVELQENPRPARWQSVNRRYLLDKGMMHCTKCHAESSTVSGNSVKWKIVGNPDKKTVSETTKEIMADYQKEAKRMDTSFKFLIFFAIWFAAGLSIYGLSFVPWTPILLSFWVLTKELTYALTRWYSLAGLAVTLFIFYRWHKQAIKDKIDYLRNIRNTRKRYRKMVEKKEDLGEEEFKSFVNEVNHKPLNIQPDLDVTEQEIPF